MSIKIKQNGQWVTISSGGGGSAVLPENVVTCDLEGATEDETAVLLDADLLGGEPAESYIKVSSIEPFDMIPSGDFTITNQRSFRYGRLVICSCKVTTPSTITEGWNVLATTPFSVGRDSYARFPDRVGSGALIRDFYFDGNVLKAFLTSSDTSKGFSVQIISYCGDIEEEVTT